MKKKIILIGAGGHAKSCIDIIENSFQKFVIYGLIDKAKLGNKLFNYKVIGSDKDLIFLRKKIKHALVTVGQIKSPLTRIKIYNNLKKIGYELPVVISKKAHVSKYSICGTGSIIMNGAIVGPGTKIGNNCIINNNCTIEHDVNIGNNCHIASGAVICGNVNISDNCFIGSGSVVKENINVGKNCLVGANTFLNKNLKTKKIYY